MEETDPDLGSYPIPPDSVHFTPFSLIPPASARLLSTHFTRRTQPFQSSSWLLYLSLVNSNEASSARSIVSGLSKDETLAWELFTPHQRFLIVAIIGVAAAESKKNGVIKKLQKSVDLRDQFLSSMQQKLDDLSEQLNIAKDHKSESESKILDHDDLQSTLVEKLGIEKMKFIDCGCWLCDQHQHSSPAIEDKDPTAVEPEERRMSYMSDWCSSVTSAAETHFDNLSLDQDMLSLRKECQEKDATIKDLTSFLHSTNKARSKRETELEEVIHRKKTMIRKLKRDVFVLEEKVTQLTRLQRFSYSPTISDISDFPMRMDNLLYDLDVLTSSSSSDSETPASTPRRAVLVEDDAPVESVKEEPLTLRQTYISAPAKSSVSLVKAAKSPLVVTPSTNRKPVSVTSRTRRVSSSTSDSEKTRRPIQTIPKESSGSHKRWV